MPTLWSFDTKGLGLQSLSLRWPFDKKSTKTSHIESIWQALVQFSPRNFEIGIFSGIPISFLVVVQFGLALIEIYCLGKKVGKKERNATFVKLHQQNSCFTLLYDNKSSRRSSKKSLEQVMKSLYYIRQLDHKNP